MTVAIFALVGVIVGAVVNGAVTAFLQRRANWYERRSAARLVRSELVHFRSLALEAARRPPENLPQLRDATPILWQGHRAVLARALRDEDWELVARAYAHIDALISVLVFEPDGTLAEWRSREAQRLLAGMIGTVEQAAVTLGPSTGRFDNQVDFPEFPEGGPVAA